MKFNDNLLKRTGGGHIILVIVISQIIGLLGAIPGFVSLQLIADFSEDLTQAFSSLIPILVIASQIIVIGISWLNTPNARTQFTQWSKGTSRPDIDAELAGWKEITNLTTIFGISAFVITFLIVVVPLFIISQTRGEIETSLLQPTSVNSAIPIYVLLAGLASTLGYTILTLLLIERFTLPERLILLPKDFEAQINGRTGALLGTKFQTLTLGLIVIGVTIIAPIGYQQAIRILFAETSSVQVLGNLQFQSIVLSGLVLFLGISFTILATRSISGPVNELIVTFQRIEAGDLNQRVPVTGTDELATVAIHFNRMVSRLDELQTTLEEQVAERTKQLTATNEVGRVASSILDPNELLVKISNSDAWLDSHWRYDHRSYWISTSYPYSVCRDKFCPSSWQSSIPVNSLKWPRSFSWRQLHVTSDPFHIRSCK